MMSIYTSKPHKIEAIQFLDDTEQIHKIANWVEIHNGSAIVSYKHPTPYLRVKTMSRHGFRETRVPLGGYLVRHLQHGPFDSMSKEQFEKEYE